MVDWLEQRKVETTVTKKGKIVDLMMAVEKVVELVKMTVVVMVALLALILVALKGCWLVDLKAEKDVK